MLLSLCSSLLITDDRQFGFKKGRGCTEALFLFRNTIEHFNSRGSTVFAAALDISKAFDRVDHSKLFKSLASAGLPACVLNVLTNWYAKLYAVVRWNGCLSNSFSIVSGVRQGSALSPSIFNVFINAMLLSIVASNRGCHLNRLHIGCIFYADDVILLSASVDSLQCMLNVCYAAGIELSLSFNARKCICIAFGPLASKVKKPLRLGSNVISWSHSFKYLGVHFVSGRRLRVDVDPLKKSFFSACNCIISSSPRKDELMHLALQESYVLPILLYASPALYFTKTQVKELNACWNSVYRKLFGFNRWESVKGCIFGLGRLDLKHLIIWRTVKFYKKLLVSTDLFLHTCFLFFAASKVIDISFDDMHIDISLPFYVLFDRMKQNFSASISDAT